ncbi:MAG: hypothetical protein ACRDPC_12465 [Solirubrobacteraceae bacterium]
MTFPFLRRKKPRTVSEEREYATFIRSAEVAMPRYDSTRSYEQIRAAQARRRARQAADDAD